MKTHDVMQMEAGRELDALVAERVMGWRVLSDWLEVEEATETRGETVCFVSETGGLEVFGPRELEDWSPSRAIADAWQVVEHLKGQPGTKAARRGFTIDSTSPPGRVGWYSCGFGYTASGEYAVASAPTAPLAICRAALLACAAAPAEENDR